MRRLLRRWRMRPDALVIATHRVWKPAERRAAEGAYRGLARRVAVMPDLEAAWLAAFRGGPGVLVLSGTGSVVFARDAAGRSSRIGGLGPLLGDEGSAFWIGREWAKSLPLEDALRYAHAREPVAAIAGLARAVLARRASSAACRFILQRAQGLLAAQAEAAAERLGMRRGVPVACHGGTFSDAGFRRGFLALLARSPRGWTPVEAGLSAEEAAARWGLAGCRPGARV